MVHVAVEWAVEPPEQPLLASRYCQIPELLLLHAASRLAEQAGGPRSPCHAHVMQSPAGPDIIHPKIVNPKPQAPSQSRQEHAGKPALSQRVSRSAACIVQSTGPSNYICFSQLSLFYVRPITRAGRPPIVLTLTWTAMDIRTVLCCTHAEARRTAGWRSEGGPAVLAHRA